MLSYSIWFSAPSFGMCDGLESRCVGRVYGADGVVQLSLVGTNNTKPFYFTKQNKKHLSLLN